MNDLIEPRTSTLAEIAETVNADLERRLYRSGLGGLLEEAVAYSLLAGGKRLRPALVLLACDAVGGDRRDASGPASALELIHTFSLVHDDLPAMDDDALRRGRPTLHVQAGEAAAILAGDAMLSLAFDWALDAPTDGIASRRIIQTLSSATTAMITGQVYDTLGGLPLELTDEQRLQVIHRTKTGALLRAAMQLGAICGNASEKDEAALIAFGETLGLMFQIVDDLLDVTQTTEHVGKATGKDAEAGKLTWPAVFGIEQSRADVARLVGEAHNTIAGFDTAADPLRDLVNEMAVRTR